MRRQILTALLILLFLIGGTAIAVLYANGYRFSAANGSPHLAKTGILNASSTPKGAQVYINDHLTSATNNTINLTPGQYKVRISKDGYSSWEKNVVIKEQLVTNTDALLFPANPALQSISTVSIQEPVIDPSGSKLAFRIASYSAEKKNGIYVLDMTTRSFPVLLLQSSSTQIADNTTDAFSQAELAWSPDGQQILASVSSQIRGVTNYLLQANTMNDNPRDVTAILGSIETQWRQQRIEKEQARIRSLSPSLQRIISSDFRILSFSPDDKKILYLASQSANLPLIITPRRIGNNLLYETRQIKKDSVYVYDITEDVNTKLPQITEGFCETKSLSCQLPITWFPDSRHLIVVQNKKINIVENDGSNMTTIYGGPFLEPYVFPWPDGSKLVIVTNLNDITNPPTLYTIGL